MSTEARPLLSIVIPVFNEAATVETIVERVRRVPLPELRREVIVVDDGSTDGTTEVLRRLPAGEDLRVLHLPHNRGKGAALREGFRLTRGDYVIIQDADLEYDPNDYPQLLQPLLDDLADVVFGSRFLSGPHRVLYFWHYLGNRMLTLLSNVVSDLNLSDMETCYKAFRGSVLRSLTLGCDRFGFEPEVTIKVARLGCRVYEVPVRYNGRTYAEGKKITWRDGIAALYWIARTGLTTRRPPAVDR